jgi:hypothetical protein
MSTQNLTADVRQLNEAVARLAEALARSERRHAHMARVVRWGVLGIVVLAGFAGVAFTNAIGLVYAADEEGLPEAANVVQALNNINANLALFGMLGKKVQESVPVIEAAIMENEDVQKYMVSYTEAAGLEPTPENMKSLAPRAVMESSVKTFVDAVVLMQRIRQDSNEFRSVVGGPGPALQGVQEELRLMNAALSSVPAMAAQMDLMNRNMASMTYSMGSTMGRMGSWMPW